MPPREYIEDNDASAATAATAVLANDNNNNNNNNNNNERTPLASTRQYQVNHHHQDSLNGCSSSYDDEPVKKTMESSKPKHHVLYQFVSSRLFIRIFIGLIVLIVVYIVTVQQYPQHYRDDYLTKSPRTKVDGTLLPFYYPNGPYQLMERQVGENFFQSYHFHDGADSIGSAGYNTYVSRKRAEHLGIMNVTTIDKKDENDEDPFTYVYLSSAPTVSGPRESIRLEGTKRYNHGLFIVDLLHMPAGCGQWPAFWLTDDDDGQWPHHGEIDVVEGINQQNVAKTALHTSGKCSMWQQVPPYGKTGTWDRAEGLFDRYSGLPQSDAKLPADNCDVNAPHQWMNQGCVAVSDQNDTIGCGLNKQQGGVYVLEWDPYNGYIRSWVFPRALGIPENIESHIRSTTITTTTTTESQPIPEEVVVDELDNNSTSSSSLFLDPDHPDWGLPYAYFAIGDHSDCSNDHFQNMRLIFNLAFCGTVAGNRFYTDCPHLATKENTTTTDNNDPSSSSSLYGDPIAACNAYIKSNPAELEEAYWKIKGVYVFQRS